jgi:hypothetical protein
MDKLVEILHKICDFFKAKFFIMLNGEVEIIAVHAGKAVR